MPLLRQMLRPARWTLARIVGRERRVWIGHGRTHIEYRQVGTREQEFCERLRDSLHALDGVRQVTLNPFLQRVVVATDEELGSEELVTVVSAVENEFGIADEPFPLDRPDHPADVEPLVSDVIQIVSDVLGIGTAAYGRVRHLVPLPSQVDLAWLGTLIENVPQLRTAIEERLGPRAADLALGVSNSLLRGATLGLSGHVVDAASRTASLRSRLSLRTAWAEREPALHGDVDPGIAEVLGRRERPTDLPDGPIERYMSDAWPVSLGGFAASLLATDDVKRSAAPLLDGIPKAARLGRSAFVSQLVRVMAERGILVFSTERLAVVDRTDHLVLEADLASRSTESGGRELSEEGASLVEAATRAGLTITLMVADESVTVDGHDTMPLVDAADGVTEIQRDGGVVVAIGTAGCPAFAAADLAVGLTPEGRSPAWDADVLCGGELADAYLVLRACAVARRTSRHAVTLAMAGAGIGATTGLGGLRRHTGRRVLQVVDTAALLAIGNGIRMASTLADTPTTLTRDRVPWHRMDVEEVLTALGTTREGLSRQEVERRRSAELRTPGAMRRYGRAVGGELANPLTPVLVGGAGLSLVTGSPTEGGMVASVIALNAAVGGAQRYRAEQALADLGRAGQHTTRVIRDGEEASLPATELVVGDLVPLEAGEFVPADLRVVEAGNLEVDESSMTGESVPVEKSPEPSDARTIADRHSLLYQGTSIAAGSALGVVVATGSETEAQRAVSWSEQQDSAPTGVEARLEQLTRLTIPMALLSGAGVSVLGLARGVSTRQIVDSSIGLAVAAVPEGLPLLATAAQRAAARRLSEHRVLVRNARAIEALGRVDVVCADKTGTLTEGRLTLTTVSDGRVDVEAGTGNGAHEAVLLCARRATPVDPSGEPLPHPTDQAVADGTEDLGVHRQAGGTFEILDDLPFEPGRSYHAVLARTDDGRLLSVKGAPEAVIERCSTRVDDDRVAELDDEHRAALFEEADRLAGRGLRVLAVAQREEAADAVTDEDVAGLTFMGFVGLRDPVRPVSASSISQLNAAGVDVVMITGDHPTTARSIADELGLTSGRVLTGPEVDDLDDEALADVLPKVSVFARVTPEHKVRIVRTFQRLGRVVAMTGDGANDAPAIRLADVGIAVGKRATAAARETADVVILDDRLEVIVDAIAEGRGLWGSVRDAVSVLVGGNLGEIGYTLLGSAVSRTPPMNARQLLLVNLLTDVAPGMALAVRAPQDSLEERLREGPQTSLGGALNRALVWRGTGTAAGATTAFALARFTGTAARARTAGTVALVGAQLGQTVATSGRDVRVIATGLGTATVLATAIQIPGLSQFVGCRPMGPVGWATGITGAAVGTAVGLAGPAVERMFGGEGFSGRVVERLSEAANDLPGLPSSAA